MRRTASALRARLIRPFLCLVLLAQPLLHFSVGAAGRSSGGGVATAVKASAPQGVEAADLPDPDEARRRPRHEPKAVPPVPSMRRRCPPRNPRCNDEADGTPRPTPTPMPTPGQGRAAGSVRLM